MPRHLLQHSVDRLAAMAAPPGVVAGGGTSVHTDTILILAAVLCFLLCVAGLAMVARCSRLCNPSAFSVHAMGKAPCQGLKRKALESLPTVSWRPEQEKEERPECAICLAEFARGDEVRALPHCGHGFHAACVDVWLLSNSTCPSCRRALVVAAAHSPRPPGAGTVADETGRGASVSDVSFVS
ncbi:RING-H2 finger protein ATL80-like [Hordeum vulgare subsp. vulgare]|uniref:RING-type domain-containing protein n=1 Tax=Hordeum vulgare subsp. vulgare TaxID=112509 RepID=A0A8I6XRT0_HORVV|nr:RING-H2 finger protein ATL80-like [Hordeum vulgare subsp. vulgare]